MPSIILRAGCPSAAAPPADNLAEDDQDSGDEEDPYTQAAAAAMRRRKLREAGIAQSAMEVQDGGEDAGGETPPSPGTVALEAKLIETMRRTDELLTEHASAHQQSIRVRWEM
jgi:hypothetical protein